jgi:hypothetical protein
MHPFRSYRDQWWELGILAVICIFSLALYTINNDFPLYFHADELKKLDFVLQGTQDFKHPILLLQLARIANLFFNEVDQNNLIIICRMVSAAGAVCITIAGFLISRQLFSRKFSWLSTVLIAISPTIVVHAHYFKEDMVFTAAAMFALFFYIQYLQHRSRKYFVGLCLATGCALAAQYKAVLLVPLLLIYPMLDNRIDRRVIYTRLLLGIAVALVFALLVNFPAVLNPEQLLWGISKETDHLSYGHTLRVYPLPHYFSFHLYNSLLPGLTAPVLILALLGFVTSVARWRHISTAYRVLIIYVLIYYFAHELTPMKPAPGFVRYMIPISPVLIIFCVTALSWLSGFISRLIPLSTAHIATLTLLVIIVAVPLYKSIRLVTNFNHNDTRVEAFRWLSERKEDGEVYFGKQTLIPNKVSGRIYALGESELQDLRSAGFRYVVASSFGYDVYYRGATLEGQIPKVYRAKDRIDEIFRTYPYHEIQPHYTSFAYSNPVVRIIDISGRSTIE